MSDNTVILCPGQGAQRVGMGKAWFDASPAAAQTFAAADEILGDRLGAPLSRLCFEGPEDQINKTNISQPAIFVTSVACRQAMLESDAATATHLAGLSLGEYTALHLAGVMSFEDALELVALRGAAMQDAAEASDGSMVALMGADEAQARALCEKAAEGGVLVPANFNAPGQIVLSGDASACARAASLAGESGFRATPLTVAGAFHSAHMAPAAERLSAALENTTLHAPRTAVMSNVTGEPHEPDSGSIRARLVEQLTQPVRWDLCGRWLADHAPGDYHELAPGKVLTGLMRRIERSLKPTAHDEPAPANGGAS